MVCWARSSVQFTSGPFAEVNDLEFMYVFNAGGTLTESSNYDGAPPVPPAYGVWHSIGPNEFEARYEYFTTAPLANVEALTSEEAGMVSRPWLKLMRLLQRVQTLKDWK